MAIVVFVGIAAAYSSVGLYMRKRFFPRESVQMALVWPIALVMGVK